MSGQHNEAARAVMADPEPGDPPLAPRGRPSAYTGAVSSTASSQGTAAHPNAPTGIHPDSLRQLEQLNVQPDDYVGPSGAPGPKPTGDLSAMYPATTSPYGGYPSNSQVPNPLPTSSAGGERLVAAMENVDRVVSIFLEDLGRAVAAVRTEVAAEREASLRAVDDTHADARKQVQQLALDKQDFERHRSQVEADLEKRWGDLRQEQESDKRERARVEREIREMSQRATAETQAAALVQMQAAQAAQAASLRAALGGDMLNDGSEQLVSSGFGDLSGMGAGAHKIPSARSVASNNIPGLDVPHMMSLKNGMVDYSADGYYPTEHGQGLQQHPHLAPPGELSASGFVEPAVSTHAAPTAGPSPGPELVFAVGGLAKANQPLWTAEVFESQHGAWRALPEMSTARGYLAVARGGAGSSSKGKFEQINEPTTLLAMGGSDGRQTLRSVEEFDFSVGEWRHVAPMSTPRIWLSAATIGSRTYAVGGYDGSSYLDLVEAFIPGPQDAAPSSVAAQGRWERCASLSSGRSTCGVAAVGSVLYCVGGFSSPNYLSIAEAYDPAADRWWGVAPLSSPRRDLGACALQSRQTLVVAGGYDGTSYLNKVEALDPRTNGWRSLAPLRTPRQLIGLTSMGDEIFAVGGFDGRETCRAVEVYDARADRWLDAAPMSAPRLGLGICCV